jgi:hypothetical protein
MCRVLDGALRRGVAAATLSTLALLASCGGGGGGAGIVPLPPSVPAPQDDAGDASNETALAFTEVSVQAGLTREYGIVAAQRTIPEGFASGLAAVDYDDDGDVDLYVAGGDFDPNRLYQNQGDGSFVDVAPSVGLDLVHLGSGPAFADIDGDADLDLFIGGVEGARYYLMENRGGQFTDVTADSGIALSGEHTVSAAFGDYDRDGLLDLALAHWGNLQQQDTQTLYRNRGSGTFESVSIAAGIAQSLIDGNPQVIDRSFTPSFSDIDGDGDADLLIVADFDTSRVYLNTGDGVFSDVTDKDILKDQAGMGSALGDYDNDGDMDWFVTSIFESGDFFGNRLYRNDGGGVFADITETAGVANGGWGWGACFADFDNDGWLDIFHVNGWEGGTGKTTSDPDVFQTDNVRFFHNQGDGTFNRRETPFGLTDQGQGRGVACFDADRDGDVDIALTNNGANHIVFYRNELNSQNHWLTVRLRDGGTNVMAVGARITIVADSNTWIRDIRAGSNFASQNPLEAHFGLGPAADTVDIRVRWPDGGESSLTGLTVDRVLTIDRQ